MCYCGKCEQALAMKEKRGMYQRLSNRSGTSFECVMVRLSNKYEDKVSQNKKKIWGTVHYVNQS
jgi:hypothetical protein